MLRNYSLAGEGESPKCRKCLKDKYSIWAKHQTSSVASAPTETGTVFLDLFWNSVDCLTSSSLEGRRVRKLLIPPPTPPPRLFAIWLEMVRAGKQDQPQVWAKVFLYSWREGAAPGAHQLTTSTSGESLSFKRTVQRYFLCFPKLKSPRSRQVIQIISSTIRLPVY